MLALFLLVLMAAQSPAQLTITVTDNTGGRVAGADVVLSRPTDVLRTFVTGSDGTLEVRDLPPGEWTLTVSRQGFAPRQRAIVVQVVPVAATVTLDVAGVQESVLVEAVPGPADVLRLNTAATGGTLLEIPIRELPASLSVVSQELIQERGARSVVEATELASGITTFVDSGSMPAFNMRGFSSTSAGVSLMRDGIRQNTVPQAGRQLDAFLLERVEVLKGPSSILYGEGAAGAAINMVTKQPQRQFGGETLMSYGSFGARRGGLDLTGSLTRKLSGRIAGIYTEAGGYTDRTGDRMRSTLGSLRWMPSESVSLTGTAVLTDNATTSYYSTPFINGVIDRRTRFLNYNMRDNINKAHNNYGWFDTDVALPGGWRLHNKFFAATQRVDWRNFEGYTYNAAIQKVALSGYFLAKRDDLLLGNQTDARKTLTVFGRTVNFVTGFLVQDNNAKRWSTPAGAPTFNVDPFNPEPIFDPGLQYLRNRDVDTNTRSLFGETLVHATNRLKFTMGARWDNITNDRLDYPALATTAKTFRPVTGRVGAVFTVHPDVNLYVSKSTAVEPVTPFVSIAGNQLPFSLQPTRQWETGAKFSALRGRLDATAAYFSIGKRNILTSTIVDGVRLQQQIGKQVSHGLELSFFARPISSFTLAGDIGITNAEYADFNENVGTGIVSRSGNDVQHVAPVVWNLTPSQQIGPVTISATVRNVGARWGEAANTRRLAPYTTLDTRVSIRFPKGTRLTLIGRNMTDELYIPRSSNTSGRVAAPRNFEAQLTKRF
jgi:iron complex outermembrane receptor protein